MPLLPLLTLSSLRTGDTRRFWVLVVWGVVVLLAVAANTAAGVVAATAMATNMAITSRERVTLTVFTSFISFR
jgi:hypothetical protein